MPYGTLDIRIAKSATRYYHLQEDTTFSYRETSPGVKTYTYRDMTAWNSAPYREGNLRERNGSADLFVMNYRFLIPNNYNASYEPGYPIIIMLHGLGERGNCWDNNCYWSTTGWNPNTNNPPAPTTPTQSLLNNDHNLLHGGQKHLTAVNLAGSKLPNDPTLPPTAFPGFLLFPQNLNGWAQAPKVEDAIRILRLMIKKYNIDENRVYIHGLSNGGGAVYQAIKRAPWLFAAALPMSAINDGNIHKDGLTDKVSRIPIWQFQGGKDINPTPSKTYNTIKTFREAGAVIRYYLYPHLGHGTWNTAYNEPDFFSWILSKRKYNPHVYFGNPVICNTTGAGVRMAFSDGFPAYQWEYDGEIISTAHASEYTANTPGTYRGRFSRVPNPQEQDWEPWSDPIPVTEISPEKPTILALGSTHLRGPGLVSNDNNNKVELKSEEQADLYNWFKNGVPVNFPGTDVEDTLRVATFISSSTGGNGSYTLKTSYSYCPSPPSDPVTLFFANSAPQNMSLTSAAVDFKGTVMESGVFLTWNDLVSNEFGYEIWRRKSGDTEFKFAGRTESDAISFYDHPLEPSTLYEYKLRAVSSTGASNYIPSNNVNINYQITTAGDAIPPTAPQQVTMTTNTIHSITLSWQPSADNTGIREYIISYGGTEVSTGSSATSFIIDGLIPNTVYPVTVKGIDFAGNESPLSNQIIASTYVLGLHYKHSTGAWEDLDDTTLLATFESPEFTGTVNNFTLAPRTQEDFFNFQFIGYLDIINEGDYTFRITSNDGARLIIDDSVFLDNDGTHGNVTVTSGVFHLTPGPHPLEVPFFEYSAGQILTVQYSGPDPGPAFVNIPDSVLRSGKYVAPPAPSIPSGLAAQSAGMQQINLSWTAVGGIVVEIYRSTSQTGTFSIIGRSSGASFVDNVGLAPGTTYYYKAKAVTSVAVSGFTSAVSATTTADEIAPSIPSNLQVVNKTLTHASFTWTASTDNTGVTGYEIFSDGELIGTSDIPAYVASSLEPGHIYHFTVKALDANDNRSAASSILEVTMDASAIYYSMASGNLNTLSTWKQYPDGTGSSPSSFTDNGQYFIIANRTQTGIGGSWEVAGSASKVVVPTGVILNADQSFIGKVELQGTARINLNHVVAPELQQVSPGSTVNFNAVSLVPAINYGDVILSGSGNKTFDSGTITIAGNLTVSNGITLKGQSGNGSTLMVTGNVTVNGSVGATSADDRIKIVFSDNVPHTLTTGGNLFLYQITTGTNSSVGVVNTGGNIQLRLGSANGGGLKLNNGSVLNINGNDLNLEYAGVINSNNETGRISINSGNIKITSSSGSNSNLYFDGSNNNADTLAVDLSGGGDVVLHDPLMVSDAIRVKGGELNANGNLTLLSTASKTAIIEEIKNNGIISGNVTVQHFLADLGDHWRDLSTTVSGVKVEDWQEFFPITGQFTGSSGGITDPSMFVSTSGGLAAYPTTTNQASIERAKGYDTRLNLSSAATVAVTGNPFQGNINFTLTGGTSGSDNGWNLVGNPYASPVLWSNNADAWTRSGVSRVIAVKENKLIGGQPISQYQYYTSVLGEGRIESGQGFWVRAYTSAPALAITEKAKTSDGQTYPQNPEGIAHMIVTLQLGAKEDRAYVLFTPDGTDGFDDLFDARKKQNEGIFNLSTTMAGSISLAVNDLPESFCSKSVPLNIQDAPPGTYTLLFAGMESLTGIGQIMLHDSFTNSNTVVTGSPVSFNITADPDSFGPERFNLSFERNPLDISTPQVLTDDFCAGDDIVISITHSQPGVDYVAVNEDDDEVSSAIEGSGETILLELDEASLTAGNNLIRVRAGFPGCSTQFLTSQAEFTYAGEFTIQVQEDVSVCLGNQAMLQASGVPAGGHYKWFDEDHHEIDSVQDGSLLTLPITVETIFQVAGVTSNGCMSGLQTIHVYADTLETPMITLYHDTLFTQVEATYQWKKNGAVVEGATAPFFVPLSSGSYTVLAFRGGCMKESSVYEFVIDPGCQVDMNGPVPAAGNACGGESVTITITNSQIGVEYFAIDDNDEIVSASQDGNGGTIFLEVSTTALDSGANHLRIRADLEGCQDRILNTHVYFQYMPIQMPGLWSEGNDLRTDTPGLIQWKLNGEDIFGANDFLYTPMQSGSYSVTATMGPCTSESEPLDFVVTGLDDDHAQEFVIHAYPVPATSHNLVLKAQSPKPENVSIKILDVAGRPVFYQRYNMQDLADGVPINPASPLSDGVYFIIATQGKTELRKRVIIQN